MGLQSLSYSTATSGLEGQGLQLAVRTGAD